MICNKLRNASEQWRRVQSVVGKLQSKIFQKCHDEHGSYCNILFLTFDKIH